jgi:hypothetical protein
MGEGDGSAPNVLTDQNTLIVIDEVGLAGVKDLEFALRVAHGKSKVICIGDRRQLQAPSGGNALRAVADVAARGAVLSQIRRQEVAPIYVTSPAQWEATMLNKQARSIRAQRALSTGFEYDELSPHANMARLKGLRLAKEASDKASGIEPIVVEGVRMAKSRA